MVTLADGTYKEICKVRPNDMIKTYDEETGKLQNSKVSSRRQFDVHIYMNSVLT